MNGADLERFTGPISLTDDEVEQNYAYRERFQDLESFESLGDPLEAALPRDVAAIPAQDLVNLVSSAAHDLVLYYEVSGKSGYDKKYRFPCWPGLQSGVTIGIGYDIGYNTAASFEKSWKALLPDADYKALARTVGRKGAAARDMLASVKHISVPWDAAYAVYEANTVPTFARHVVSIFPNSPDLHPHSFGALFSLVYNRGPSLVGDRRRHMKNIHNHTLQRIFPKVPREFRDMKVLWDASMSGLHKRRDAEAKLFEQGLIEKEQATVVSMPSPIPPPPVVDAAVAGAAGAQSGQTVLPSEVALTESLSAGEGDWAGMPDDITEDMAQPESFDPGLEARQPGWTAIAWVESEDNSTEYRHIIAGDRELKGCEFEFTARDLDLLIRANSFDPLRGAGKIIFGLRGATLLGSTASPDDRQFQIDRASLRLKEARPNHHEFRCVMGVYDLATGRISGFVASTVPKRDVVYGFAVNKSPACNLLPGGCYTYVVGPHRNKAGCLRETENYAVVRNRNNMTYDVGDDWDDCFPADNIHPSFVDPSGSAQFSSLGCQVVKGSINSGSGAHTGPWALFRKSLGLTKPGTGDHGKKFSYVLLTGIEAAIAVQLREQARDTDFGAVRVSLGRLRHGSKGDQVRRLEAALGLPETGTMTSSVKFALAKLQKQRLGAADGVYAPALDTAFSFQVFGPQPMVVSSLEANLERLDSDDALYLELGRRAVIARTNPELAAEANIQPLETMTLESMDYMKALGQRMFARIEKAAHELICGDQGSDQDDRTTIQDALIDAAKLGPQQLLDTLTGILTTSFGILGPVAAIVAKLLVQKVLAPALHDMQNSAQPMIEFACRSWATQLNVRVAAAGISTGTAVASAPQAAGSSGQIA